MKNVLIDSDVILDFFFDREPFSSDAAQILTLCESKKIVGWITPIILSNVYYLLCRNEKHSKVIEKLKLLVNILEISSVDKNTIEYALNSKFNDFEDAIQNFSAELNAPIKAIITRNSKDYKHSRLAIFEPKDFIKLFNKAL